MRMGPGKHLQGRTLMGGLMKPEEFDYFHELIYHQEGTRIGARSFNDGTMIPFYSPGHSIVYRSIIWSRHRSAARPELRSS